MRYVVALAGFLGAGCTYQTFSAPEQQHFSAPEQQQQQEMGTPSCESVQSSEDGGGNSSEASKTPLGPNRAMPLWSGRMNGYPQSIVIADFDNDGNLDMGIIACEANRERWENCTVSVLRGLGDGQFEARRKLESDCMHTYRDLRTGDFDGDGVVDLVALTGPSELGITYWLGQGNGEFTLAISDVATLAEVETPWSWYGWWSGPHSEFSSPDGFFVFGDFVGDGRWELSTVREYFQNRVLRADVNQDGKDDTITFSRSDIAVLSWGAPEGVQMPDPVVIPDFHNESPPPYGFRITELDSGSISDVNGDGNVDIVMYGSWDSSQPDVDSGDGLITLLANDPAPKLSQVSHDGSESIYPGDVNADGNSDIFLLSGYYADELRILLGDGTSAFAEQSRIKIDSSTMAVGDFDKDGATDVVVSSNWDVLIYSGRDLL